MSEQVFISYRRKVTSEKARLMRYFIQQEGFSVFLDTEINHYESFPDALRRKIEQCSDYIFIVSKSACCLNIDPNADLDWIFEELKIAYDTYNNKLKLNPKDPGMRLHLVVTDRKLLGKFSQMDLPERYRAAHKFICNRTAHWHPLDFDGNSDEGIRAHYKQFVAEFESARANSERRGAPVYVQDTREQRRLSIQGEISFKRDRRILDKITEQLHASTGVKRFRVLDVGCSKGDTGKKYFSDRNTYAQVLGIDRDADMIAEACEAGHDEDCFSYRHIDLVDRDFNRKLTEFRNERLNGGKFDIIFCCQTMHYLSQKDRSRVLNILVEDHLRDGGCLIIRGSDDGTKVIHRGEKEEDIVQKIVALTVEMPTIAERFYGRMIDADLRTLGLERVTVQPITVATSMICDQEQANNLANEFYKNSFEWRKYIFEPKVGDSPAMISKLATQKEKMEELLEELRTRLLAKSYWYMETDFFGYGFKPKANT